MNRLSGIALAAALLAQPALAFEFTGASAELGHSTFTDDSEFSKTYLQGSAEFGFGPTFGMQADLGLNRLNAIDETASSVALHGLYHVTDQTSLGLFYGIEEIDGDNLDFYGFEVGQKTDTFSVEAYIGRGEDSGISGSIMGLEGRFPVAGAFGVGGKLQHADVEGLDLTRVGLTGDYTLPSGLALTAEVGSLSADAGGVDGSEAYVGVGARINFGPQQGTSFGNRGILDILPGF